MIVNPVMYGGGSKDQFQVKITGSPGKNTSTQAYATIGTTEYTEVGTVTADKNTKVTVTIRTGSSKITFNGIQCATGSSAGAITYSFPLIADCEINFGTRTVAITTE